jgi:hypothetical protein
MFLVGPSGQSHRLLLSKDWWTWSEQEIHGAEEGGMLQFQGLLGLAL